MVDKRFPPWEPARCRPTGLMRALTRVVMVCGAGAIAAGVDQVVVRVVLVALMVVFAQAADWTFGWWSGVSSRGRIVATRGRYRTLN